MGRSAIAAAAYRSGEKLTSEWDGLTRDYTHKPGVVHSEIMLPARGRFFAPFPPFPLLPADGKGQSETP